MSSERTYSLAFLTIPDVDPRQAVHIAADAGYQMVGLRMLPATAEENSYPILSSQRVLREVAAALADRGVRIGDLEIIRLAPHTNTESFIRFFDTAQFLDARHVTIVNDDPVEARAAETLSRLCESAAPFNLTMNLEPMPWTATRTIGEAARIVGLCGQRNAGILIDAFHFYRGGSRREQLETLSPDSLNIFQICDAPADFDPTPEVIRHMARTAREIPGQGELDLASLISLVPATAIISVEIPSQRLIRDYPPYERAARALAMTQKLYSTTCAPQMV